MSFRLINKFKTRRIRRKAVLEEDRRMNKRREELAPCTGNGTGRIHGLHFISPVVS